LAETLREKGFREVRALQGGFDAWLEAGLPVDHKQKAA
jgi:rhodanese-related sulfurtransferase